MGVEAQFHRIVVHFAMQTEAMHPELFLFSDDSVRKAKIVQPVNAMVCSASAHIQG